MIVVDTNVVSETVRAAPAPVVVAWLDAQLAETLYISAVSLAELLLGVAVMPEGARRRALETALTGRVLQIFGPRVLAFDAAAARAYAELMSRARTRGRAIGMADGQIAAIAMAQGMTVASRDTGPFEAADVRVINPWES